jgi:hypothetical protein
MLSQSWWSQDVDRVMRADDQKQDSIRKARQEVSARKIYRS